MSVRYEFCELLFPNCSDGKDKFNEVQLSSGAMLCQNALVAQKLVHCVVDDVNRHFVTTDSRQRELSMRSRYHLVPVVGVRGYCNDVCVTEP